MIEKKTSSEIFEDVFMEDTLDNKNKEWVSKDSLLPILEDTLEELENQFPEMKVMNIIDDFKAVIKELKK
jgi:predicted lysophospholipase L1 biosynthesis ABC-type transport system permease subunit